MHVTTLQIPAGDAGTSATIAQMRRLIDEGKKDPVVYETARQILAKARVKQFDFLGEARAIYESVRRNMRFTRDVRGKETLHAARELLRLQMGDCDDYTILTCALMESVGLKTRIKTVANDERDPETFTHVFPEVLVGGRWIAVDAARMKPAFGKAPRVSYRTRVWDTETGEYEDLRGLAGFGAYVPGPAPAHPLRPRNPRMPARLRAALGSVPSVRPPARAPRGQGNYGARALSRLGEDADALDASMVINSGEVAAANIISALRANPNNLAPTTTPGSGYATSAPQYATAAAINWGPILLLGGGVLVVVLAMRKH